MKRRKLAWALAALLALLAALALTAWGVLVLPARDYRLAWMLSRTKRVEVSSLWARSIVVEVTEPGDIAAIVSAVTSKLDRQPGGRFHRAPWCQTHFFLESGAEIVLITDNSGGGRGCISSFVRAPGRPAFEPYALDDDAHERLCEVAGSVQAPLLLGTVCLGGKSSRVSLVGRGHEPLKNRYAVTCQPAMDAAVSCRVVARRGAEAASWHAGWTHVVDLSDGDDPLRIEFRLGSEEATLEVPRFRHHDPVVPPCPGCRSDDDVVPLALPGDSFRSAIGFHGKCKPCPGAPRKDPPELWCERCRRIF